jgi:hypothetical protein
VPEPRGRWYQRSIFGLQVLSIMFMWAFLASAIVWMVNVVGVSRRLGDALTASVGISVVAVSVYSLVASVLTYVFFGLRRGRSEPEAR